MEVAGAGVGAGGGRGPLLVAEHKVSVVQDERDLETQHAGYHLQLIMLSCALKACEGVDLVLSALITNNNNSNKCRGTWKWWMCLRHRLW